MTAEIRANMEEEKVVLQGLYAGQSARMHPAPTSRSVLDCFARKNITGNEREQKRKKREQLGKQTNKQTNKQRQTLKHTSTHTQ